MSGPKRHLVTHQRRRNLPSTIHANKSSRGKVRHNVETTVSVTPFPRALAPPRSSTKSITMFGVLGAAEAAATRAASTAATTQPRIVRENFDGRSHVDPFGHGVLRTGSDPFPPRFKFVDFSRPSTGHCRSGRRRMTLSHWPLAMAAMAWPVGRRSARDHIMCTKGTGIHPKSQGKSASWIMLHDS